MNEVILIGYVQDETLTLRTTASGDSVLNFTVRVKKNKEVVEYIDCTAWKNKAEFIAKYFKKNDPIIVIGELNTSVYEKNGMKIKKYFVTVETSEFCPVQKSESKVEVPSTSIQNDFVEDEDAPWF